MKYGILAVHWYQSKNLFVRHWVALPDTSIRVFDNLDDATEFAEEMHNCAREEGILGVDYRARLFHTKALLPCSLV